ncbi:Sec-independent protein translocase protein TatB [Devosia sp.]|uniref:Sec-independent protein translocase protein TatB n=1 Tax=Devosia sp. TaxID=1871048 RepID=UPI003BAD072F
MLGVGWTEMLVIGVVALIVIGPKDLPVVMGRIGKFAATIRRMGSEFQRELNKTTGLNEITNLRNSVTAPLKATADAIRKEFNTTTSTGAVQPSGALKPADPKVESVVYEIKAAAGMSPAAPAMTPLTTPAPELSITAVPAKPKRTPRVKVPPVTPVAVADIPPAAKPAKASKKPIESPAPVEAIAPAKVAKPAAKAAAKPAAAKPAATKAAPPKPKAPAKVATVTEAPAAKVATKAAPAAKAKPKAAAPAAEPAAPLAAKKPATRKKT